MQKQLLLISMFALTGGLSVQYAKAMDDFPDSYPRHLNLAKTPPGSTLKEDMNHLYKLSADFLRFPDEDKKRALLKKINATRNLLQNDSTFSSYTQSLQFLEQNAIHGECLKTTLPAPIYISESDNIQNSYRRTLISQKEKKRLALNPVSSITFQNERIIYVSENHSYPHPHETNLEEKFTRKLSPESLDIIRPLFELYENLHQDHIFRSFKNKIFKIYHEIPKSLYPELDELLEKLTIALKKVQSFPDNEDLKVKLSSKKQSLRKFYKSNRSQVPTSLDIHSATSPPKTEKPSRQKRPREDEDVVAPPQKKTRVDNSEGMSS